MTQPIKDVMMKTRELAVKLFFINNKALLSKIKETINEHNMDESINPNINDSAISQMDLFYKNLYAQFPSITRNENELCGYIKLNYTTKDISEITGRSVHSIQIARVRLRKKLGLNNTKINLTSFMHNV